MPSAPKLQRWTDLLAALLRRHYPVTFEVLRKEVPAYAAHTGPAASMMRKFERDKDEFRAFRRPDRNHLWHGRGPPAKYRFTPKSFYLQHLQLATDKRPPKSPKGVSTRRTACTGVA